MGKRLCALRMALSRELGEVLESFKGVAMPPKERVSKEMVRQTAFAMTKEYGFEAVTARRLAEQLGCSTQPIFRAYENMDELRCDLFYMSAEFFADYMLSKKSKTQPFYVTMGMAYIELAVREKNLFGLIASVDDFGGDPLRDIIIGDDGPDALNKLPSAENLSTKQKQELFTMVWMFTHGVASMVASNRVSLTDKEIKSLLVKAYEGFVVTSAAK